MPVDREYINVAFTGGIDEDADPRVVSQPFLKEAENVRMDKRGSLRVRDFRDPEEDAGAVVNPRMHRFRESIFVTTDTDYALFNTRDNQYRTVATLPRGYNSEFVGANDGGAGSHRGRITKTPIANHVFSAFMEIDSSLNSVLRMRVQDGVTGEVVWSDSLDDHLVLDVDYNEDQSSICVFTRDAGSISTIGAPNRGCGMVVVTVSSGAYSFAHYTSAGPIPASASSARSIRQGQIASSTGSRVYLIMNYLPNASYSGWGVTYCGWFDLDGSSFQFIEACDGTTAERDGSGMVAVGIDPSELEVSQAIFLTCSKIDSTVNIWRISSGTTLSSQVLVKNVLKSYGPITQGDSIDDIPEVWEETASVPPKGSILTSNRPSNGGGSSLMISLFAHGHNFMYGSITAQAAGGELLVAWHGIAYHKAVRQVSDGAVNDHHMTAGTVLCSVSRTGNAFTVDDEKYSHSTFLLGNPIEVSAGVFHVPTTIAARWFFQLTDRYTNAGPGQGFIQLRLQGDTDDDRIDLFQGNGALQYSAGNMLRVEMSDPLTIESICTFGPDEVMPHTSPYWTAWLADAYPTDDFPTSGWLDKNDAYNVTDPLGWRKFDIHTSGAVMLDNGSIAVGCTKWASNAVGSPYDGPQSFQTNALASTNEHDIIDWNASARRVGPIGELSHGFIALSEATVLSTSTPEYGLVESGGLRVFDGLNLFPLDWYVPPQPMLMQFEAYRGDRDTDTPKTHKSALCWSYKDAKGVVWRSAPSFIQSNVCKRWKMEPSSGPPAEPIDIILDVVGRPPPFPAAIAGSVVLEYYTNSSLDASQSGNSLEGEEDVYLFGSSKVNKWETGGKPVAAGTDSNDWYKIFGLSLGWTLAQTKETPVPLYTTGGVLESEPPNPQSGLAYSAGRVWYAADGKAYFSKQVRGRNPIGWNANLFVESPEGDPIVAVSSMDEYVVLLTKNGLFLAEGQGPNDLGRGGSFQPYSVASPVGCWNSKGVLSTHIGVFFPGPDSMYLLKRDLQVVRIGNIEDSLSPESVNFAVHHPRLRLMLWNVGTAPASEFLVFDYENGWWGKWTGSDVQSTVSAVVVDGEMWSIDSDGTIRGESDTPVKPAARVRTGWIHAERMAGYKRVRNVYVVGAFAESDGGDVDIEYYYDYSDTASETRTFAGPGLSDTSEVIRHRPARSKCSAISLGIEVRDCDATLSHVALEVGVKRGPGSKITRD